MNWLTCWKEKDINLKYKCEPCKDRGWYSTDMMGSEMYHCDKCNTHETKYGRWGSYVVKKDINNGTSS